VADKSTQLIVDALSRAAAGGAPLHSSKATPGLFPATSAGRLAAVRCREEGYLALLESAAPASNGSRLKKPSETWGLSEKGLAYLLGQASPRQVLTDLVRALEERTTQLDSLLALVRQTREQFTGLRTNAEIALRQLVPLDMGHEPDGSLNTLFRNFLHRHTANGCTNNRTDTRTAVVAEDATGETCASQVVMHLRQWQSTGAIEDCPLPELFRRASAGVAQLTIGCFHDCLRRLRDAGRIYLHPWTGSLHDVPEPAYAVMIGHEVGYYASLRMEHA
jgi:hypothetical protein